MPSFFSKPNSGVQLDPSHGLSQKLMACVLFNEGAGKPVDVVNNLLPTHSKISWTRGSYGHAADFRPINQNVLRYGYGQKSAFLPVSILIRFKITAGSTSSIIPLGLTSLTSDIPLIYINLNYSGTGAGTAPLFYRTTSGTYILCNILPLPSINDGNWHTVVYSLNAISGLVCIDGVVARSIISGGPITTFVDLDGLCFGSLVRTGFSYQDVSIDFGMVWERTLYNKEMVSITHNPWQIFKQNFIFPATQPTNVITLKTSDLLFNSITNVNLSLGVRSLLSTRYESLQDSNTTGYVYRTGTFEINGISNYNIGMNVYKPLQIPIEAIAEVGINYVRRVGLLTEFNIINTFSLSYIVSTSATTHILSENFDAIINYSVNGVLKRTLLSGIEVVNNTAVNGISLVPTSTRFDIIDNFDINAIRAVGREIAIEAIDDFNFIFTVRTNISDLGFDGVADFNSDRYTRAALGTDFISGGDSAIYGIRSFRSDTLLDVNSEYNLNLYVAKIIEAYIDADIDSSLSMNIVTALNTGFDAEATFSITITNAVVSYIFTAEISLVDRTEVTFYL